MLLVVDFQLEQPLAILVNIGTCVTLDKQVL